MVGSDSQLPHTLVPLALAVTHLRSKLSEHGSAAAADPNAIATFIAATVPIWEYWDDPGRVPRPLLKLAAEGLFRDGGKELHFLDGRPSKHLLAVHVDDINCVIEMLQHPDSAVQIRARVLRTLARKLRAISRASVATAGQLRSESGRFLKPGPTDSS